MESVTINMRVTESEKAMLVEAAKIRGQTLSAFIRECAVAEISKLFPHATKPFR